ncbi:hypothetical protein L6164_012465 [Bauhinia variegata]|uniref:Uncharacterized protein n=1 Tax=Bauhinia variegata TaxID=167791 RepID=A0ACB9PA74_BAUVA|nr:hypothetical protein L6164_012465 [Bauhinia variegata]
MQSRSVPIDWSAGVLDMTASLMDMFQFEERMCPYLISESLRLVVAAAIDRVVIVIIFIQQIIPLLLKPWKIPLQDRLNPRRCPTLKMVNHSPDLERRFLIIRGIGEECIQEDELRNLLATKPEPICYDGFEPSGRTHIAQS